MDGLEAGLNQRYLRFGEHGRAGFDPIGMCYDRELAVFVDQQLFGGRLRQRIGDQVFAYLSVDVERMLGSVDRVGTDRDAIGQLSLEMR